MTRADMDAVTGAYSAAARRGAEAGFDMIEPVKALEEVAALELADGRDEDAQVLVVGWVANGQNLKQVGEAPVALPRKGTGW